MFEDVPLERITLAGWFSRFVARPSEPIGDYFERLRVNTELSAPVCTGTCL